MPTDRTRKRVLVAGATGRLGGLVDVLLARGHTVRAIVRDPDAGSAARVRDAGAEIVFGDFEDRDSLAAAAAGVDAIFATGTAHRAGPDGELRHGHNLADAVAAARVPHLVYCSGDGAAPDSPVPLFRVKHRVEDRIRSLPTAHTILAPVYFMENLFNPWNLPALQGGALPSPVDIHLPLQQVAVADLVALAALAIERPAEFAGRRIKVASDELTAAEAAEALSRVSGRRFEPRRISTAELGPPLQTLFSWLEEIGHDADIAGLRRHYPEVGWHSYESWLRSQEARLATLCPREHVSTI